ncbi:Uncharacterised protein g1290 [Pycnogonum litorale]
MIPCRRPSRRTESRANRDFSVDIDDSLSRCSSASSTRLLELDSQVLDGVTGNTKRKRNEVEPIMEDKAQPHPIEIVEDTGEKVEENLHQAARNGDVEEVKQFLTWKNNEINDKDENGLTALHYACLRNNLPIVSILIDKGGDVNAVGRGGLRPLHCAAKYYRRLQQTSLERSKRNKYRPTIRYVEFKRKNKVRVSKDGVDDDEMLEEEKEEEETDNESEGEADEEQAIIQCLRYYGADVNAHDDLEMTALHYASMNGNEVAVKELLVVDKKYGAAVDIEMKTRQNMTALHLAAVSSHKEIVDILLNAGADPLPVDRKGETVLHHAALSGQIEIVKLIFKHIERNGGDFLAKEFVTRKCKEGNTVLHVATDCGHSEIVKFILKAGCSANISRKSLIYPLHLAAENDDVATMKLLMDGAAEVDCLNITKETPLHRAAVYDCVDAIDYLISKGGDKEKKDKDGMTPLLSAAYCGSPEAVKALIKHKSNLTAVDKNDRTAVYLATDENSTECVEALLGKRSVKKHLDRGDKHLNTALHVAAYYGYMESLTILLKEGAGIDCRNEERKTPLHIAAEFGRTKIVKELIDKNDLIVSAEDEDKNTPIHLAASNGHVKVIRLLIDAGADLEALNSKMWTPLDCAAAAGHADSVKRLLDEDVPVDPLDFDKATPLHLAVGRGHIKVMETLLENGADVAHRDVNGWNSLDHAIENNQKDAALLIINHSDWRKAMCNTRKLPNDMFDSPMRLLIRKMPDVAEAVFNRCIEVTEESGKPIVVFNYEFLDDTYTLGLMGDNPDAIYEVYDENYYLKKKTRSYTRKKKKLQQNHPLKIMADSKRQALLEHPLCISLMQCKWQKFASYFIYLNVFGFVVFLFFLTGYILAATDPSKDPDGKEVKTDGIVLFLTICEYGILIFSFFNILREIAQMYEFRLDYVTDLRSWLEWICFVSAILFVLNFHPEGKPHAKTPWQWQLGAVSVTLAWIDLIIFLRKFPMIGIYVVMLVNIMRTFSRFFFVFFLFIVAFTLCFYTLLQNQISFRNPIYGLIKTSVMMIGEFEFESTFSEPQESLPYPTLTYTVFVVFLIVMSIILMNVQVGLAVDDIKGVQEQSELQRLAMQVDTMIHSESVLPRFLRHHVIVRQRSVPADSDERLSFIQDLKNKTDISLISSVYNPEKVEREESRRQREELYKTVMGLKDNVKDIKQQNLRLQSLLMTMLKHQEIDWEDEDEFNL